MGASLITTYDIGRWNHSANKQEQKMRYEVSSPKSKIVTEMPAWPGIFELASSHCWGFRCSHNMWRGWLHQRFLEMTFATFPRYRCLFNARKAGRGEKGPCLIWKVDAGEVTKSRVKKSLKDTTKTTKSGQKSHRIYQKWNKVFLIEHI